jgi:hypothetical protein
MATCFVIQPFDGGAFDKRYEDVFEPAIRGVGLEPYRVDRDPSVSIPIEQIESGIRSATVCLADITTDNPNVWFELGFAIASRKDVVMVCSDDRKTKFPFDVQHRTIIKYSTESLRDFRQLQDRISERLTALLKMSASISSVAVSPLEDVEGLSQHEIVALVAIAGNLEHPSDGVSTYIIRQDAGRAGYTSVAITIALAGLLKKSLIVSALESDYNGEEYTVNKLTDSGMQWLIANQDKLVLRREPQDRSIEDDIPF